MNMEFLNLLSDIRTPLLTDINLALSVLGEGKIFIIFLCLIFWCIDKKFAYRMGIIYIVSGLTVQCTKIICRIPRPWIIDDSFEVVKAAKRTATGYSFPSGHTQNITALFSSFAVKSKRKLLKFLCFLVIFLVMFSRMYLGVHTPADVLTSFGITLIVSLVIHYYSENYAIDKNFFSGMFKLLILFPVISIGVTAYIYYFVPDVITKNLIDVVQSAGAASGFLIGWHLERKYVQFRANATTLPFQMIKFLLGIVSVLLLNYLFDFVIHTFFKGFLPIYFIPNMLITLFIVFVYPLVIKHLFTNDVYL